MTTTRQVSHSEAATFLRLNDKMKVFKPDTVGFLILVGALQAALATAPNTLERASISPLRQVSDQEAIKWLREHDQLNVLKKGTMAYTTAVGILQTALAYSSTAPEPVNS